MLELAAGEFEVELNDVRIHYTVRGVGPALLAHSGGPGADARGWADFAGIDRFATVVMIHPRGSGLSGDAPDPSKYRLVDYAADLEGLREHLGLSRPAVIGWSHGGMVAQVYACEYPDSLSRLILYDTSAYFGEFLDDLEGAVQAYEDQPWFENSFEALQKEWAGEYETAEEMAALWAEEMKFYFFRFDERAESYHRKTADYPFRILSLKAFNEAEAETLDLRPRLKEIKVPTLVIVGRHDFITNVAMAEEIVRRTPDSKLIILERSGHFGHIEEPERFYQAVKEFLLQE